MAYDRIYQEPPSAEDLSSMLEEIDIMEERKRAGEYGYAFSRMESGIIYYGQNTPVGSMLFLFPAYMGGKFIMNEFDSTVAAAVICFIDSLEA